MLCFPTVSAVTHTHTHRRVRTHTSHSRQVIFITKIGFLFVPLWNSADTLENSTWQVSAACWNSKSVGYTLKASMQEKDLFRPVNKKEGFDKTGALCRRCSYLDSIFPFTLLILTLRDPHASFLQFSRPLSHPEDNRNILVYFYVGTLFGNHHHSHHWSPKVIFCGHNATIKMSPTPEILLVSSPTGI